MKKKIQFTHWAEVCDNFFFRRMISKTNNNIHPIEKLDVKNDIKNNVKNDVKNWDSFLRHFLRRFLRQESCVKSLIGKI